MLFGIVQKSSFLWSLTACLIKCQSQVNPVLFCCPAAVGFLNGRKMVEWMQVRLLGAWTENPVLLDVASRFGQKIWNVNSKGELGFGYAVGFLGYDSQVTLRFLPCCFIAASNACNVTEKWGKKFCYRTVQVGMEVW